MDLEPYIRQSENIGNRTIHHNREKKCLECRKQIPREDNPVAHQQFCSQTCKDNYCGISTQ